MVSCLVTGVAGFIGSHLAEKLISSGHTVLGVDCFTDYYSKKTKLSNLSGLLREKNFRFTELELASQNLSRVVKLVEFVFHLAAQPGVRSSWGGEFSLYVKDNIIATQRLLESLKDSAVKKFIYASSSSVYGDSEKLPTSEDVVPRPNSPYGVTKLAAENLCNVYQRNFEVPIVSLRYFSVYGPRQRPDMAFHRFINKIFRGERIQVYGDGRQTRDYTYVGDIVNATILAMEGKAGSLFNVGTGNSISLNRAIGIIESLLGKKAVLSYGNTASGDVKNTSADISRIQRELGYKPALDLKEGLQKQIEWQLGST